MRGTLWNQIPIVGLCLLLCGLPAAAQTTAGSIVGTVTDTTGSIVPNAAVTVTNEGTGITFSATTDTAGNYVVTPIPVGRYTVTVETKGFKKAVRAGIIVNVQDRIGVNVVLEVGEISDRRSASRRTRSADGIFLPRPSGREPAHC